MSVRASDWLSSAGLLESAAEQALAVGQSERAFDMVEGVVGRMLTDGRIGAILERYWRLPDDDFLLHPGFWTPAAWALVMSASHAEALPLLDRMEAQPDLPTEYKFEASLIRSTIAGFW